MPCGPRRTVALRKWSNCRGIIARRLIRANSMWPLNAGVTINDISRHLATPPRRQLLATPTATSSTARTRLSAGAARCEQAGERRRWRGLRSWARKQRRGGPCSRMRYSLVCHLAPTRDHDARRHWAEPAPPSIRRGRPACPPRTRRRPCRRSSACAGSAGCPGGGGLRQIMQPGWSK